MPPILPADKLGHFFWGAVAGCAGAVAAHAAGLPPWAGAIAAALVVGVVKDVLLDLLLRHGRFDPLDIVATAAGGLPAALGAML